MTGPDAEAFAHTVAFQQWLSRRSPTIVCTTNSKLEGTPYPLASYLAQIITARSDCQVIYVDCFCVANAPSQHRPRTRVAKLQQELNDESVEEDLTLRVLEAVFCQLFGLCPDPDGALSSYNDRLAETEASDFQSHIQASGLPGENNLLPLTLHLLQFMPKKVLLSIDGIHHLKDSARKRLVSQTTWLGQHGATLQSMLCGDSAFIGADNTTIAAVVTDDTEAQGASKKHSNQYRCSGDKG